MENDNVWVSVDEYMPDDDQFVIVAWRTKDGKGMGGRKHFYGLATYEYYEDEGCEFEYSFLIGTGYKKKEIEIIAWAPVPEPYDGE